MPRAGPSVAAIPLPLQLADSHLVHLHPSPSTTAAFPSCTSHLPPILSFTAYVLAACLSLPPYDFGAVLPADSRDAGAAPPVPLAFADRPTAAPLASPAAVPPPAYSLPAAAWAPRPDTTRPAVGFAQDALPGAGTPVAATRSAGFQSYTCACTATPLQLNLPPSNLLYLPPTLLHHHLRSLCPSLSLSLPPLPITLLLCRSARWFQRCRCSTTTSSPATSIFTSGNSSSRDVTTSYTNPSKCTSYETQHSFDV